MNLPLTPGNYAAVLNTTRDGKPIDPSKPFKCVTRRPKWSEKPYYQPGEIVGLTTEHWRVDALQIRDTIWDPITKVYRRKMTRYAKELQRWPETQEFAKPPELKITRCTDPLG